MVHYINRIMKTNLVRTDTIPNTKCNLSYLTLSDEISFTDHTECSV